MLKALRRTFDYSSRFSRREYWSFLIGLAVLLIAAAWASGYRQSYDGLTPELSDQDAAVGSLAVIVLAAFSLALRVRRSHYFGWSGWAVLWTFVPLVNVVMKLMLLFCGSVPEMALYPPEAEPRQIASYNSAPAARPPAPATHHVDQIARPADLHAQGALTAQEFAAAKAKVLRS